jgi:hypothetical protein
MHPRRTLQASSGRQSRSRSDALIGLLEQFLQQDGHPPELLLLMANICQHETRHAAKAISFLNLRHPGSALLLARFGGQG